MRRLLALLSLLLLIIAAVWLTRDVGWALLARHQAALLGWVNTHPLLAGSAYVLAYIVTAALSLPHGVLLTAAGGLLFGTLVGAFLTAIGATIGAGLLMVLLRTILAETLRRQQDKIPTTMRARLARDGFSYLLVVRLLPVFPFWLVNLTAAVAGLPLAVFVPATLIGVLPVTFIVSSIGSDLGAVLAAGHSPDLSILFAPRLLLPLIALAALSLLPILLRGRLRHA